MWRLRSGALALDRPRVVGILNVTPDSFSDGGRFRSAESAFARAREMAEHGADLIDVGGESTRPGAAEVGDDEEARRVLPVVSLLKERLAVPISVDTRKAAVAREALALGADVVNDVSALGDPNMAEVVARSGAGLVLMHMRGTPATMQARATYDDVAAEVARELGVRLDVARAAGIDLERVVLDPGVGFAKTAEQNLTLIAELRPLLARGRPVLLGPSRKAFLGALLNLPVPAERDAATLGVCIAGLFGGARLFRVHDVRAARHALDAAWSVLCRRREAALA